MLSGATPAARSRGAVRREDAAALQVVIGRCMGPVRDGGFALGWIVFEEAKPKQDIYVSYSNV